MSDEYTLDDALQYIERAAARCENHASETKNMVRTGQANSDYLTLAGESQREAEQLRAWVEIIKENHTRVLELEAENARLELAVREHRNFCYPITRLFDVESINQLHARHLEDGTFKVTVKATDHNDNH